MNDILLQKQATIKRCIIRMNEFYNNDSKNLSDLTRQDSIILNLQRICQASIDMAMYVVSTRKLGLPKASQDGFKLLEKQMGDLLIFAKSVIYLEDWQIIKFNRFPSFTSIAIIVMIQLVTQRFDLL